MDRYVDGDAAAFRALYAQLAPVVLACQRRWVGDPVRAEDLTQETFLRVHKARDRYRSGAPVGAWVLTIARRLSIDSLRRRAVAVDRVTSDGELPEPPALVDDGATPAELDALLSALREAVQTLPESQRQVVAMHKLEGLPLSEVAARLGINEGAARVRAHRGYERLRALFDDRGASGSTLTVALTLAVLPALLGSAVAWASTPHGPPGDCFAYGTVVGLVALPVVFIAGLGGLLRRRGPTLVYVLVGASALALVPVSLQCPDYTFPHLVQGHATLLIAFGLVGLVGDFVRRRLPST